MKKLIVFFFFFFFPVLVQAESLELESLKVKNGILSLPFDSLNNEYTVEIESDVYHLVLEYNVSNEVGVSILNNHDLENNQIVTIELRKEDERSEYHLHILKEESEKTAIVFNEETELEDENIMYQYKIFIIPTVCFLLICLVYKVLFHKKNKNKVI